MRAKFIGDPNDDGSGPKVLRMAYGKPGQTPTYAFFPRDAFAGVPTDLEAKVRGMDSHMEIEDGEAPLYVPSEREAPQSRADRAMDGDDNGKRGGSLSKVATLERLDALKAEHPEIEYDAKWGLPKLRGILEEAEFTYGDDE